MAYEPGTRAGTDPEDLHQMRVAVRRTRSVLKDSGRLLGDGVDGLLAELGWLGSALGDVRDDDVLIARLRETVAGFDADDQPAARRLVSVVITERRTARRRLTRRLDAARYPRLLEHLAEAATSTNGTSGDPVPAAGASPSLVATLRKAHRKFAKAVDALPAEPADDDLHALRIRCKRLRYAAELARSAAGKKERKKITALVLATKDLQTTLGEHQDAVVAAERVRALLGNADEHVGFVAGRIVEREYRRRAEARARWPAAAGRVRAAAEALL